MKKWIYIVDFGTNVTVIMPGSQFFVYVLRTKVEVHKRPYMPTMPSKSIIYDRRRKINKIDLLHILFDRPYAINIEQLIKGTELYQYEKGKI